MATSKSKGGIVTPDDSKPKYLGVKLNAGEKVKPGMMIVKQRGTKFVPGKNTRKSKDDSLYAIKEGVVEFQTKNITRFDGSKRKAKIVNVN